MSRRAEVFSPEHTASLLPNNPWLALFQKNDWPEYLQLIAVLYDAIETDGPRVEYDLIKIIIEHFYEDRDPGSRMQKANQFYRMAVDELEILLEVYSNTGERLVIGTRNGKNLLRICEELIRSRRRFSGKGADVMLGALNELLLYRHPIPLQDAIEHHQQRITEYEKDMERMRKGGVQASEFLGDGSSPEELFVQAEEAARQILLAGEDIKEAIETARRELAQSYRDPAFSAGQAIQHVADFHSKLRGSPEYASFRRASDLLSFIEGLGGRFREKDVSNIFYLLGSRSTVPNELLQSSDLRHFSDRFASLEREIAAKIGEQLNILRVQVHYVLENTGGRAQADLSEWMALMSNAGSSAFDFLGRAGLEYDIGLDVDIGAVQLNPLEVEFDVAAYRPERNELNEDEWRRMHELLLSTEEATIGRVVERLRDYLSRNGSVRLSEYPIESGIPEIYILSNIESYAQDIRSEFLQYADIVFYSKTGAEFIIQDLTDRRFTFVGQTS
jgi:hypothetical protein